LITETAAWLAVKSLAVIVLVGWAAISVVRCWRDVQICGWKGCMCHNLGSNRGRDREGRVAVKCNVVWKLVLGAWRADYQKYVLDALKSWFFIWKS
jgi:hypothetical protein